MNRQNHGDMFGVKAKVERAYDEYAEGLYRYAVMILADHGAAEDAVQQVFIKIMKMENKTKFCHFAIQMLPSTSFFSIFFSVLELSSAFRRLLYERQEFCRMSLVDFNLQMGRSAAPPAAAALQAGRSVPRQEPMAPCA